MRKTVTLLIGAASVAALLAITACKQFTADIEEELGYWAAEPVITNFRAASPAQTSSAGVLCVSSASDAVLTLTVHNPKNFSFIMPNSPGAPADIVSFGSNIHDSSGINPPAVNADYTLLQSAHDTLTLTYKPAFLKRYEHSRANIGASIKLYSTDGRKFSQNYKFDLEANTPPPDITEAKWGKTQTPDTDGKYYYVLCISVPAMPGTPVNGKPLHKDIAHIAINDTEYELKMKEDNSDFKPMSAPFLTAGEVTSLDGAPLPSGPWVLYYTTPTELGSPQTSYTVTLKDAKGLRSQASATTPTVPITDWEALRTAVQTASDGAVITVGGDITYSYTDAKSTKSTIEVTKSITVKSNVNGTKRTLDANGTGADGTSANSKVEAVFEVKGSGITLTLEDLTLTKTEKYAVYVPNGASLEMTGVTIEDCKTNFNAAGICFHGGKDLSITNSVIKKCKGKGGFSAGGIDIQEPQADGTLSITGTTFENCKAVGNGTRKGNGGGINIYKGSLTLTGCTFTGCGAENGGGIYAKNVAGTSKIKLTATTIRRCEADRLGGGICIEKGTLTLENATIGGSVADGNKAKNGGGIYVAGAGSTGEMTDGEISFNEASNTDDTSLGGGICIKDKASFTMKRGTINYNKSTPHLSHTAYGGGVCVVGSQPDDKHASFTLQTGTINHNTADYGGGVMADNGGEFTMTGGDINDNEAKVCGGGVAIHGAMKMTEGTINQNKCTTTDPTFGGGGIFLWFSFNDQVTLNMTGGTISGNNTVSSSAKGAGVLVKHYSEVKMQMSGAAKIDTNNDVYLSNDNSNFAKITLPGPLSQNPAARITPETYGTTTQVLAGSVALLNSEYGKFTVTPKIVSGNTEYWTVGGNGCLKQGRYTEVPYGQLAAYLANASSTEVNYIEVTGISAAAFVGTYGSPPNPGPLGELLNNNPSKKVALKLPNSISGLTSMDSCFVHCKNLVSLENLPSGVENMRACFYDCKGLTTGPDIPATVTNMKECFRFCDKLQSVKINRSYFGCDFYMTFKSCDTLPNGGIQVPSAQLGTYTANAGTMGTTPAKFSAIP